MPCTRATYLESLLKADKENFEISYSDIINVEIMKAGWRDKLKTGRPVPGLITIKGREEPQFQIAQIRMSNSKFKPQKLQGCVDLLRSVLSDKLSVKA
jgi:hypothetical protein